MVRPQRISKLLRLEFIWTRSAPKSILRESYPELLKGCEITDYLAAKQVPSCLAIMGMGCGMAQANPRPLIEVGYPISIKSRETGEKTFFIPTGDDPGEDPQWGAFKPGGEMEVFYPLSHEIPRQREIDPLKTELRALGGDGPLSVLYAKEPFEIFSLRHFAEDAGVKPAPIIFYPGDVNRLTDKISSTHFPGYNGKRNNRIAWLDLNDVQIKLEFIFSRTFWGVKLKKLHSGEKSISIWAKNLSKRINHLLRGLPNPNWTESYTSLVYTDLSPRQERSRAGNFLEMLKTINGEFVGRFLAFPNEQWSWEKFDLFVLDRMSFLIDDLFYDGALGEIAWDYVTKYSELKRDRKNFKMHAHLEKWEYFEKSGGYIKDTPAWLRPKGELYASVGPIHDYGLKAQVIGILSQTRGAGKPPPLDVYKAERKFLETVSSEPEPMSAEHKLVLRHVVHRVINQMPDEYFTGLSTKARVTVEAKACYEKTRAEGGTEAAVQELVWDGAHGVKANVVDLNNGTKIGEISYEESTEGEYIFWRCLEIVLKTNPDELTTSFVTMVKEPGKGRTVTKGSFALKIVLDVISKICSWPLTKVPSSKSGMGMEAHGWNFFMSLYEEHEGTEPFLVHKVLEERTVKDTTYKTVEYKDLYVECTDFSEATDNLEHEVAQAIAVPWMKRCGIPELLQKIVIRATMRPKRIEFTARGLFSRIGNATETDDVRYVTLRRGVLMGDPLTKVILHIDNIAIRECGTLFTQKEFWKGMDVSISDNPPRETEKYRPIVSPSVNTEARPLSEYFAVTPDAVQLQLRLRHFIRRPKLTAQHIPIGTKPGMYVQRPIETLRAEDYKPKLLVSPVGGEVLEPLTDEEVDEQTFAKLTRPGAPAHGRGLTKLVPVGKPP